MASNQAWRRTKAYRNWKYRVKKRDGCCVMCGSKTRLEAHHLENGAHNPDLRFILKNGATLCRKCHTAFHCMYKKSFGEKSTQDDFCNFIDLYRFVEVRATANVLKRLYEEEAKRLDTA